MNRSVLSVVTSAVLLSSAIACGGAEGTGGDEPTSRDNGATDDTIASHSDALTLRTRFRVRSPHPISVTPGGTGGASSTNTGTGGTSSSTAPINTAAAIAAAQTPDGAAIPQSSLPGGRCPDVVVAIGFWSCLTVGDQCTYASGGVTHHCTCNRVDGEGQYPAWVCD